MHIEFVEIANFRKLLAARVDLSTETTLFVGANNSGKTSAMLALRRFLTPRRCPFEIHDFTLCHWQALVDIGQTWIQAHKTGAVADLLIDPWVPLLPVLDLWLQVREDEVHRVRDLVPLMEWSGGLLGVRLRYEPKDLNTLYKEFFTAITEADSVRAAAVAAAAAKGAGGDPPKLAVHDSRVSAGSSLAGQARKAARSAPGVASVGSTHRRRSTQWSDQDSRHLRATGFWRGTQWR